MTREQLNLLYQRQKWLIQALKDAGEYSKAERVTNCKIVETESSTDDNIRVDTRRNSGTQLCKVNLCPVCKWRRGLKQRFKVQDYFEEYIVGTKYEDCVYEMLTLTVPSCPLDELSETLNIMTAAFASIRGNGEPSSKEQKEKFNKAVKGTIRVWEITYNSETKLYHPHFHICLAITKSAKQNRNKGYYLNEQDWKKMWSAALGHQKELQVNLEPFDDKTENIINYGYATELSKELPLDSDTICELMNAIKHRPNPVSTGIFRIPQKRPENA